MFGELWFKMVSNTNRLITIEWIGLDSYGLRWLLTPID